MLKAEKNSNTGRLSTQLQERILIQPLPEPKKRGYEAQTQRFQYQISRTSLHPSGLTWERWEWPFPTPQEREIIARYFKRTRITTERTKKRKIINKVGEALL